MLRQRFLLSLSLLVCAPLSWAQTDLIQLYQQARQFDPQFIQAQAQWNSEQELLPQARARLLPTVNAQANYTQAETTSSGGGAFIANSGDSTTEDYNVTLVQPIYNHGAWSGYSAAKQQINSAEASYKAAEQSLILRLAEAYFSVLSAQDNLAFAKAEQTAIQRQLNDTQDRYDVGMIAITDLHETQAAADLAVANAIDADNQLMTLREALYAMTGNQGELQPLSQAPTLLPPAPNQLEPWLVLALQHNADMLAAEANYQARADEVSAQRSGHYPNLELIAQHSQREQSGGSFGDTENEDNRYIVRLNVPLYAGGSVSAKVRSAAAQRDAARSLLDWRKRQAQQTVRQAFNNVRAAIARARALEKAALSSQTSLESVQAGYDAGTRTSTDVLNAEREVLRAQRNLSRAHYDYLLNQLRLKQAAGQLGEGDLKQLAQTL